jgi:ABC-type polysaccharide/polyol phosphate transport system ATPase subunit
MVSHNTQQIENMCQRAAWLDHGQIRSIGETKLVTKDYRQSQNGH